MIQPIYIYGSEVLRAKAEDIDLNDKEYISNLVKDLKETLAHADGCGLAKGRSSWTAPAWWMFTII